MIITYKDDKKEINEPIKVKDLFAEEIKNSKYNIMGCLVNNEYQTLTFELKEDSKVEFIDMSNKEGMKIYRRTLIYILGKAFGEVYPEALLSVDYQLAHSMFCEVDNMEVTDEMIEKVSNKIKEIVAKNLNIERKVMNRQEAEKFFEETGTIRGRLQLDIPDNNEITMYFCENYYNYSYGMLASNTGLMNLFELQRYDDGFLIKYQSSKNPAEVAKEMENKQLEVSLN